jgi:hypothetical protein
MRLPCIAFCLSAVSTAVLGSAGYAFAQPFWRISPQACLAEPADGGQPAFYNAGIWFAPSSDDDPTVQVTCGLPSNLGVLGNSGNQNFYIGDLSYVWSDVYVVTPASSMGLCATPYTGGSYTCGPFVNTEESTGYVGMSLSGSDVTWINSSTYQFDFPAGWVAMQPATAGEASFQGMGASY